MCSKMLTIWFWLWAFWLLFIVFFFCRLTDNWTMDASREKYWYGCGWGECLQLIQQNLMQFDTENFHLKDDFLRSWHACCSFWSCLQGNIDIAHNLFAWWNVDVNQARVKNLQVVFFKRNVKCNDIINAIFIMFVTLNLTTCMVRRLVPSQLMKSKLKS